jgi:hypothetical protein
MITLTTPNSEKIYFKGTTIEIASVVLRLEFSAPMDGKSMTVVATPYEDEAAFDANPNNFLSIDGVEGFALAYEFDLSNGDDPETWKAQTITVAHDEMKAFLDGLGYLATISGI